MKHAQKTERSGAACCLGCWTGLAFAQANSIEAFDVAQQGGNVVVRITTKEPVKAVPPSFTVANPARIVFDFRRTPQRARPQRAGSRPGRIAQHEHGAGADRTRLVLNLRRSVAHEVALDGKNIVVTLSAAAAAPGSRGASGAFRRRQADAKHAIREVDFRRGNAGEGRIMVDLTDTSTGIDIRQQGQNIVVEFLKTSLPENLRRRLDVVDFATRCRP
jgi:type IV pilus assembly protein PilQ